MKAVQVVINLPRRLYKLLFSSVRGAAEACLFVVIGLLAVDVIGRYVFDRPTLISYEITGYLLVGITFLALAYGLREGSHVKVTILVDYLPASLRKWLALIMDSVALIFIIVLMWKSIDLVRLSLETGTLSMTFLATPMWIPQLIVPIGLGMLVLEVLHQLVVQARELLVRS